MTFDLPVGLKEKIFQINKSQDSFYKIMSYFPLSETEQKAVIESVGSPNLIKFNSIFSDHISEKEWDKSKAQIIKKFQDELFEID